MSYPSDTKVDVNAQEPDFADANGLPPALQPSEISLERRGRRIRRIVLFVFLGVFIGFHLFKTYNHFHERHNWSVIHHAAKEFYLTNDVSDEDLAPLATIVNTPT
ncbi:hypothetical protein BS47DRAFT_1394672 [Hydnum rufescens UP504]|uniref:Uncharacterized protein n=1 Tax=Hydnum rufescens UP504 TaxID=1448309 RepID=A0A9P6DRA4_9AGAM|nr:hypothetical protein BS47DRAFT_1394672 [Hydnum rufescens UP504]